MSFRDKVDPSGEKKLLALDGGGVRGVLTLEILVALEDMLQRELGRDESFVLADYFDYVAGTSTGAIIAAGLALGMSTRDLLDFYTSHGEEMFDKASLLRRFRYKFEDELLAAMLRRVFGEDTTLGSDRLRSLLMVVLRNATTDSPWPVSNNPLAKYNDPARPDCNLNLPLWQLVRASAAAPAYFPPEVVRLGPGDDAKEFVFVDGGVTTYNNPAFQLFLMATLEAYRLCWRTGEREMLLVSVGTGTNPKANADLEPGEMNLLYSATSIPSALMFAALNEQDLLCRVFGRCRFGAALDREIGDLRTESGPLGAKLFTYIRYNAELSREGLDALGLPDVEPAAVAKLDSVEYLDDLRRVGRAVAASDLKREHFEGFLG